MTLSPRGRSWLSFATMLAVVVALLALWGGYRYARAEPAYRQLPPGEAIVELDTRLRLISLQKTQRVEYESTFEQVDYPAVGETLVVATVEATGLNGQHPYCRLAALDSEGRMWNNFGQNYPVRGNLLCTDVAPGSPTRVKLVYRVPTRHVDQLVGLAYLKGWAEVRPVLTPER